MSHLPSSQMQRQRTARKPVVASPRQVPPPKRLNQRDLDSSCHRLSRVPQKFATNKAIQNEKSESFAVNYFKKNPDARDSTPPDQKLQEIEDKLNSDGLETSERFTLLVRQKALRYILYGENSAEALRSHAAIGFFYNENNRPASAIRHLTKAHQLEEQNDIEKEESLRIAIETAEAYINIRTEKKSENVRNFSHAEKALAEWTDEEIEDPFLRYRRDLCFARISYNKGRIDDSIKKYEEAWQSLDEANNGEEKAETATLFYELAHVYEYDEKRKKAAEYYQKAYDIYKNLDMNEEADMIEPYLPTGSEVDQGEEEQKENEEEDENEEQENENENEDRDIKNEDNENENDDKEKENQSNEETSSQNGQKSQQSDNDDKNSEHSEKDNDTEHSDHSEKESEENHTTETEKESEENHTTETEKESEENHTTETEKESEENHSSNGGDSDKEKDESEGPGKAEQLLTGFGNALAGGNESTADEKSENNDDEDGSSSPNKMNTTSGFDDDSENKSETDTTKQSSEVDTSEAQKSEKPKSSDTGGFDEDGFY